MTEAAGIGQGIGTLLRYAQMAAAASKPSGREPQKPYMDCSLNSSLFLGLRFRVWGFEFRV